MDIKIFRVEDFGAVGDGVTDDGKAIATAIRQAVNYDSDKKIVAFQKDKTYRAQSLPEWHDSNYLFFADGAKNLTICGENTKLLLKVPLRVLGFKNCENVLVSGFIIDYSPKPYIIGTVIDFSVETGIIDCQTNQELGFDGNHFDAPRPFFSFPNTSKARYHYFIDSYDKLKENVYRMNIRDTFRNRITSVKNGDEFILPYVGASHMGSAAFMITQSSEYHFENIRILSLPEFGFDIRYNLGKGYFNNIVFRPDEKSGIELVSWRDGFHVKDNLGVIHWTKCDIGPLGDDAFNLSCVQLDVQSVSEDKKTLHLLPAECGKTRRLSPGDEFCAYSLKTGKEIGFGTIVKVFESENDIWFEIKEPLPLIEEGNQVSFYKYGNAGYIIEDCLVEGTVRVRGQGTFINDRFDVFWVRVENESYVEGPIPKDVLFKNCTFTTPYDDPDANIFCVSTQRDGHLRDCEYKCKNIVMENCNFEKGKIQIDEGNEFIRR
ncbi:MAG: hypothetical protein PHV07_03430 [Oscillospiraceae bacterium]|nr:hypothetical protein [Oscillospiraceae bacterium]